MFASNCRISDAQLRELHPILSSCVRMVKFYGSTSASPEVQEALKAKTGGMFRQFYR